MYTPRSRQLRWSSVLYPTPTAGMRSRPNGLLATRLPTACHRPVMLARTLRHDQCRPADQAVTLCGFSRRCRWMVHADGRRSAISSPIAPLEPGVYGTIWAGKSARSLAFTPPNPAPSFPGSSRRALTFDLSYENKRVDSLALPQANHDRAIHLRELGIKRCGIAQDPYPSSRSRDSHLCAVRAGAFEISPTSTLQMSWKAPKVGSRGARAHERPGGPPAARRGSPRE
jgi:hypothetical protein